jgi:hypothetical protein
LTLFISILVAFCVVACATAGEATRLPRQPAGVSLTRPDRADCELIRGSDLRSPQEGIWFQSHCLPASAYTQGGIAANRCNRLSLDVAEFRPVADGLYVYRQTAGASAFLWYATGPDCFALVSDRLVTAVCMDRAVSFKWDARSGCAVHGGVLTRINGQ